MGISRRRKFPDYPGPDVWTVVFSFTPVDPSVLKKSVLKEAEFNLYCGWNIYDADPNLH